MKTTEKRSLSLFLGALLFLLLGCNLQAQLPSRPEPQRLVNDLADILTPGQVDQLEKMLDKYNDTTSTQILVITVDDLQGYDPAQFATEIGQSWGVGQGDKDNGAVVLVKPKTVNSNGQTYISVGYGLEQYITDAAAKQIVEKEMIPSFKEDNYFTGILKAVQVMMDLCSGKFTAKEYTDNSEDAIYAFIFLLGFAALVIYALSRRSNSYSSGGSRTVWTSSTGGHRSGGFGGGHSGGFSGFGGGHFGGGGAGGSW